MGRPVTKTKEQREAKYNQWFVDNADCRRKYCREFQQRRRAKLKAEMEKKGMENER
jgi:hypothetical protein